MKKEWSVTDSMGNVHRIAVKMGGFGGNKYTVDNDTYKLKSKNWFVVLADYQISLPGIECNLVAIGSKVRLAVNGTYLDDGTAYEPVRNMPVWSNILVAVSCIVGFLFAGWLGLLIGVFVSMGILKFGLEKKTGAAIGIFAVFMVVLIIWFIVQLTVLA